MSSSGLLSLAGWAFLPGLVTGWIQAFWYSFTIRAGDPKPQPGSPKYALHRRRIHIMVVSAYLLYTIYEADWEIRRAGDFYQDLGIPHSASEREIKSRFRRLAAIHHPDKVSSSSPSSEGYFVHLKLAQDTLLNPVKRFAYERFGPEILSWQRCSSIRDYLLQGLLSILTYYGSTAIALYTLNLFGYLEWGKYWRWLAVIIVCVFELHTISRPYFPPFAAKFLNPLLTTFTSHPPYLPFQVIQLLRKISVTMYIAITQIMPLIQSLSENSQSTATSASLDQQLNRLEATAKATDIEMARLVEMEMSPFREERALEAMKGKVKEWLVRNTINSDPEVRDAIGRSFQKRRTDAPAGARGNR